MSDTHTIKYQPIVHGMEVSNQYKYDTYQEAEADIIAKIAAGSQLQWRINKIYEAKNQK